MDKVLQKRQAFKRELMRFLTAVKVDAQAERALGADVRTASRTLQDTFTPAHFESALERIDAFGQIEDSFAEAQSQQHQQSQLSHYQYPLALSSLLCVGRCSRRFKESERRNKKTLSFV